MINIHLMLIKTKTGFTIKKIQPVHRYPPPAYHWIIPMKNRTAPLPIDYMAAQNNVVPVRSKPVFALNNAGSTKNKGAWR